MNSLYHKIAVASICTALSFTLGANQEAKAATFTLTVPRFLVFGTSGSGGLEVLPSYYEGPSLEQDAGEFYTATRAFYEFDIGDLSLAPDTVISRAFFNVRVGDIRSYYKYFFIDILGYVGNGIPELSDFEIGERLSVIDLEDLPFIPLDPYPLSIDVTGFVNQRVSNGDAFAGFGLRNSTLPSYGTVRLDYIAELTIETEPVPEPTTIFGSVLALGVGGWLKRKKSSQQNKTTPQN
jgi:hypothetical protein